MLTVVEPSAVAAVEVDSAEVSSSLEHDSDDDRATSDGGDEGVSAWWGVLGVSNGTRSVDCVGWGESVGGR